MLGRLRENAFLISNKTAEGSQNSNILKAEVAKLSQALALAVKQLEDQDEAISLIMDRLTAVEQHNRELQGRVDASEKVSEQLQKAVIKVTKGLTEVANSAYAQQEHQNGGGSKVANRASSQSGSSAGAKRNAADKPSAQKPKRSVTINNIPILADNKGGPPSSGSMGQGGHGLRDPNVGPGTCQSQSLKLSSLNTTGFSVDRDADHVGHKPSAAPYANVVQSVGGPRVTSAGKVVERIKLL